MPHDKPIGIDLGTTNSAMAWVDEAGRSAMIANAEGEFITPSVVFFSESEVVVGKNARTAITSHPEMVAQWVKRDMGAAYYSHPIRGHYLPPEVIQACILRKLKADLVACLGAGHAGRDHGAGLFRRDAPQGHRRRRRDGRPAGLDIVNEPTAAALAFGEALGYLSPAGSGAPGTPGRQELNVLVYDLGGGTFDATLLRLAAGKVQTLATDGDVQLGGHDWDQRLVDYAAECFLKTHQLDPRQDPATLNRLYLDAMEAKHTLSARSRAVIQINYQGRFAEIAVTREQFEEMTADLLERTSYTSRQLLGVAGLEWKDVQRVLLVGGSTRMPMVPRMLQGLSGIQPDRSVNPDEAVARGAALYAGHLLAARARRGQRSTFQVTNVNAHSLGVEGIDTDTLRKKNVVLIPRNTPLPARHTERFATKSEGQRSIVDQGPRRRKLAAGRLHRHRPHRGPRSSRRAAQGLAGGSHLRIRRQRPAGGRGPGAGHAASGPAGVGPRDGAFQRRPDALEAAGGRGGRIQARSSRRPRTCCAARRQSREASPSGIGSAGASWRAPPRPLPPAPHAAPRPLDRHATGGPANR